MNPTPQAEAKPVQTFDFKPRTRLVAAAFVNSIPFAGETTSVQVGRMGSADSIVPARMETDGTSVPIEKGQRPDGLLIKRKVHDRSTNQRYMDQCFVPWSNIRGLQYGE